MADPPPGDTPLGKTNLECFQGILSEMTAEVVQKAHLVQGESISVRTETGADAWIVENALVAALKGSGLTVFDSAGPSVPVRVTLRVTGNELRVRYTDMFREGLFGKQRVRRTVTAGFSVKAFAPAGGEVLFSDYVKRQYSDSVVVEDIPRLELAGVRSTHAELPQDSFIERFLEPVVIIGATGVAVFLFFHVRT